MSVHSHPHDAHERPGDDLSVDDLRRLLDATRAELELTRAELARALNGEQPRMADYATVSWVNPGTNLEAPRHLSRSGARLLFLELGELLDAPELRGQR